MRRIEPAQPVDAGKEIVGDAVHHLLDVAEHISKQAAEIGDAGGRAHAAQKTVALDQQACGGPSPPQPKRRRCRPARRQHHHLVFAAQRNVARRFVDHIHHGRRLCVRSYRWVPTGESASTI